jgi:integrase
MPLTDKTCRNAKAGEKIRKLPGGGGLQLWVMPNGSKLWRFHFHFQGLQKDLPLGVYPTVSLAQARIENAKAKAVHRAGMDPCAERKKEKLRRGLGGSTFKEVAEDYVAKRAAEKISPKTIKKTRWLLSFAYPALGSELMDSITPQDILAVLQIVENRKIYHTAHRLRSTVSAIFRYGVSTGRAQNDPTALLKGALIKPTVEHRSAMTDPASLGGFLRALDEYNGQPTTRIALNLIVLLFARPTELRFAVWSEFDLKNALWTIPKSRTKNKAREHLVPLAKQALELLDKLKPIARGSKLLFPGIKSALRPMSENTMNGALRNLGYAKDDVSSHGFRTTASTMLNQTGQFHPDAIERQLSHQDKDRIRGTYNQADHLAERKKMMTWWANYCDQLRAQVVTH